MPAPVRRPPTWDGHLLLLYRTEVQRRAGLGAWMRRGLDVDALIYYTQPQLPDSDERSLGRLLEDVPGAGAAFERGQIVVVNAEDESAYDLTRTDCAIDAAREAGYSSIRWAGEVETAWSVMSADEHARVERVAESLCRATALDVLCQFRAEGSASLLRRLAQVHGGGVRDALFHATPLDDGMALAGEVDASNSGVLLALLAAATTAAPPTTFRLDLRDLEFLDVGGARALLDGTARFRAAGGTLRLQSPQPLVGRVCDVFGVHRATGVDLEEI